MARFFLYCTVYTRRYTVVEMTLKVLNIFLNRSGDCGAAPLAEKQYTIAP